MQLESRCDTSRLEHTPDPTDGYCMLSITITEQAENEEALADLLEHLAGMVREGYTSGYYPHWTMLGDPEPRKDDE